MKYENVQIKKCNEKGKETLQGHERDNTDDLSAFFALHVDHRNTSRDVFPD